MKALRVIRAEMLAAVLLVSAAASQTGLGNPSKPAPNAWMRTPTPSLAWNQGVPASVREKRDSYLDLGAVGEKYPLTAGKPDMLGPPRGSGVMRGPEIQAVPDRAVLTGKFTEHHSVLSASEYSLYSEVTIHVDQVFDDRTGRGTLAPGQDITILFDGGTVILPGGRVLSHHTEPVDFCLEPEHKYLLVLSYQREGDFYILESDWDITDGIVRPNTYRTQSLAKRGLSLLNGLKAEELGPSVRKLVSQND